VIKAQEQSANGTRQPATREVPNRTIGD